MKLDYDEMNYNDYYSKKHLHMARDEAENNAAPRRPNTRRRFDPSFGVGGSDSSSNADKSVEKADNAGKADKPDRTDTARSADLGREFGRDLNRDLQDESGESERRRQRAAGRNTSGRNTYGNAGRKSERRSERRSGGRRGRGVKSAGDVSKPAKIGRVMLGSISGLVCSLIVLAACAGFYGIWCYSHGLPGDVDVKASVCMYCVAVLLGSIWGTAAVRGRSKVPVLLLVGVFMVLSIAGSWQMFGWAAMKPGMIVIKLLMTVLAAFVGWVIGGVPYLLRWKRQ